MPFYPMMNLRASRHPSISYRPIQPKDLDVLIKIHGDLFPIRYEIEFFHNVVQGRDIVSWGAVDRNRPNGESDELIGFVTARIIMAKESEIEDMLRYDRSRSDQTLVYILTLGVVESYRNFGIATSLIREVIKYASSMPNCRAVYLHGTCYASSNVHEERIEVGIFKSMEKGEKNGQKRVKYRDKNALLPMTQNKRSISIEGPENDHV